MASDPSVKGTRRAVRIGKYEVVAHIATGGMGAVYRAIDTELGREVALKVLSPETASNPATLERFRREARHSAKLRHENIVTLYECGEANGTHFLAMEFVDGTDLHDYINRKGQLEPEEARQILIQAVQALDHAHEQGIVHRDIKPSNFLLTWRDDQIVVKLTDMGLAREMREDEFRVTKDGSTVGTVDYLSPEQARDSRAADVRSDIYSLGCTFYHVLAGKPPFPTGSLAERIYKHIQVEPPDIRQFNMQVSDGLWEVLKRMLAKDPAQRYQTPADLLCDLHLPETPQGPTPEPEEDVELVAIEEKASRPVREKKRSRRDSGSDPDRRAATARRPSRRPYARQDTEERPAPKTGPIRTRRAPAPWMIAVGAGALVVAAVAIVLLLRPPRDRPAPPNPNGGHPVVGQGPIEPEDGVEELMVAPRLVLPEPPIIVPRSPWPPLYTPAVAIRADRLREEYEKPWTTAPARAPDAVLRVSRGGRAGAYDTLAAAVEAASPGKTTAIEIHDNGPLFEVPVAFADRHIILRAGKNYRPLLVWDVERSRPAAGGGNPATAFLSATRGSLTLEGIDLVLGGEDATTLQRPALVRVTDGDFRASDCTFSLAGRHRNGVVLVRFEGKAAAGKRCRLSRCFARGASLVALDLEASGAEVLFEDCLIAGGEPALLAITAADPPRATLLDDRNYHPPTLRLARSTLVAGRTLLHVRPLTSADRSLALHCHGWDTLLARTDPMPGGEMIVLAGGAAADAMQWRPTNCLYAGWKTLLVAREALPAADRSAWLERWRLKEGDGAIPARWPAVVPQEPAEAMPDIYRTDDSPVAFAATSGVGSLGCKLAVLPAARDNWLTWTFRGFTAPAVDLLMEGAPPGIPSPDDGLYHGERLDLTTIDLGAYLAKVQASGRKLGPRVVFHLHGSGQRSLTPIRIRGSSLVLYFEPPEKRPSSAVMPPPLVLIAAEAAAEALIDVENGDLEIIGGEFRMPESKLALVPRHLLRVRAGNLLAFGARLQGPVTQPADHFRALLRLEGPEPGSGETATGAALNRCVLLSGKTGISAAGVGVRLRLQQSVLVARHEAFHLDPGYGLKNLPAEARPRLDLHCLLENCTIASQRAMLFLADAPFANRVSEPAIFEARASAFLNPFPGPQPKDPQPVAFLLHQGDALARGLLLWRGEGNVLDSRLTHYAAGAGAPLPAKNQTYVDWTKLWGAPGDRQPLLDLPLKNRLDSSLAPLENLALTGLPRLDRPPGANLAQLGLLKPLKPPK